MHCSPERLLSLPPKYVFFHFLRNMSSCASSDICLSLPPISVFFCFRYLNLVTRDQTIVFAARFTIFCATLHGILFFPELIKVWTSPWEAAGSVCEVGVVYWGAGSQEGFSMGSEQILPIYDRPYVYLYCFHYCSIRIISPQST